MAAPLNKYLSLINIWVLSQLIDVYISIDFETQAEKKTLITIFTINLSILKNIIFYIQHFQKSL